jgi:predicted nucleotidyltransferase
MVVKIQLRRLPKELRREGLEEKIAEICQKNDIIFMAIFGSFAKGKQGRKSDIDIAIEFDKNAPKNLLDLIRIERELSKIFGRKVDLGILSSINPHIIDHVKKEMRVIYEKR